MSPLCESYLRADQLNQMEPFYPLHVWVCDCCYLVQLEEYVSPAEIFTEYAYFSSYADTWLQRQMLTASGGGVYFGSMVLRRMGYDVGVVTRLARADFARLEELNTAGIYVSAVEAG